MVLVSLVVAVLGLALFTQIAAAVIERRYRPSGQFVEVDGGRLHVVELGPSTAAHAVVLLHGASCNLEAMRLPLAGLLSARYRTVLIDRPGHGYSTRASARAGDAATQAAMVDAALGKLGIDRAVVVAHSWSGALGAALALGHRARLAGLVMLAPVTHPWSGGVSWYNALAAMPVIGWVFTRLITLPVALAMLQSGARSVFEPQAMPEGYVRDTALALLVRPREFAANAHDIVALKPSVTALSPRYGEITTPAVVISGTIDTTVSIGIHSRPFAAATGAQLIELDGVGHMPHHAAPELVADAIAGLLAASATSAVTAIAAEPALR